MVGTGLKDTEFWNIGNTMKIVKKSPVDESFDIWKDEVEGVEYKKKLR